MDRSANASSDVPDAVHDGREEVGGRRKGALDRASRDTTATARPPQIVICMCGLALAGGLLANAAV